jgi:hypothetical protein
LNPQETVSPQIKDGLVESLAKAYATLVKRQRSSTAFVRWTAPRRQQHDFVWLDPGQETLFSSGREVSVKRTSPAFESINGMMSAIELNPYERELYYGYPYLYGFVDGVAVRAPVFAMPVSIVADGSSLVIAELEDVLRFNSLPFRTEHDSTAKDQALARLIDATPALPLSPGALRSFCENLVRDLGVQNDALLDGSLAQPPAEPKTATPLRVIDAAACFIAPKGNYFLASDLELIAAAGSSGVGRHQRRFPRFPQRVLSFFVQPKPAPGGAAGRRSEQPHYRGAGSAGHGQIAHHRQRGLRSGGAGPAGTDQLAEEQGAGGG